MLAKESRVTGKQAEWQELGAELNARRLVGRTIPGALRVASPRRRKTTN